MCVYSTFDKLMNNSRPNNQRHNDILSPLHTRGLGSAGWRKQGGRDDKPWEGCDPRPMCSQGYKMELSLLS